MHRVRLHARDRDRVQAPARSGWWRLQRSSPERCRTISAAIVLPIASVVHRLRVSAEHLTALAGHRDASSLACIAMPRSTVLERPSSRAHRPDGSASSCSRSRSSAGTYYQWTRLSPVTLRRMALAADDRARQPTDLCQRRHAGSLHNAAHMHSTSSTRANRLSAVLAIGCTTFRRRVLS